MNSVAKTRRSDAGAGPDPLVKAAVLAEALPYMRRHAGNTLVVKYGGHAMGENGDSFARDVVLLKQVGIHPIVVHGGGPQIGQMLNKGLVAAINAEGGCAIGLTGKDGGLIAARKLVLSRVEGGIRSEIDLGFVGEPERVAGGVLETFMRSDIIPIIAPIGVGGAGETYNINADTVAGAVAAAVRATRLLLLTDVAGVLDADQRPISEMTSAEARRLIGEGVISGGMIPKVETCLAAVERGVEAAVILDGRVPHAILLELFTDTSGAGTLIRAG
jgi:acetylglutamate kinase